MKPAPTLARWKTQLQRLFELGRQSWQANPRLRILLSLIALIIIADASLRWLDGVTQQLTRRTELQAEVAQLQRQTRDPQRLQHNLADARLLQQHALHRILLVRSEAQAQARLQDWLTQLVQQNNVQVMALSVGSARPVTEATPQAKHDKTLDTRPRADMSLTANMTVRFTPDALNTLLLALEDAEWIVRIDSLSVRRAERRVDIVLSVPVRIEDAGR